VRLPWESDARRPTRGQIAFWAIVAAAAVAFLVWIHHRDSTHDNWDWSDWVEAAFASACGGFVVTGVMWVAVSALLARLPPRSRVGRRSWLPRRSR
jgi:drug/metabolite transporter (DMT)-like permease